MKISDNGKVIFDGAFDVNKIDFNDKETVLDEDFTFRYNDESILTSDMIMALYDFMVNMDFFGNDDDLTKFYLFCGIDGEPCLSAWCKPCVFDYNSQNEQDKKMWQKMLDKAMDEEEKALIKHGMIEDEKLNKECTNNQRDALEELERDGGYEITTFDIELTNAEKQQLKKVIDLMLVKTVE
ncbi:MAG TPA: hypothetical protein DC024_10410 [Clostridiales bacterium]|jgi:hypothetical protein|nr:hypothetical protein [Clostridiales bacterium]